MQAYGLSRTDREIPKDEVRRRVLTAFKTLRAVPDGEEKYFHMKSCWPDYPDDYKAVRIREYYPTREDLDDMLVALEWISGLARPLQEVLWFTSFGISTRGVATLTGASHTTVAARLRDAVFKAWRRANHGA